jgi:hypothetical protein
MKKIDAVRGYLLTLHKAVIDEERRTYERTNGRVTAGEFLDVLANGDAATWLRPFTQAVVELDEQEAAEDAGKSWLSRTQRLLRPDAEGTDFQRHYDRLVQESPDVLVAHGAAMRALRTLQASAHSERGQSQ